MPASVKSSSTTSRRTYASIPVPPAPKGRLPVTPAVLRAIFASSRSAMEERSISRIAFFRFAGFILSCIGIAISASRGRMMKGGAGILGVV